MRHKHEWSVAGVYLLLLASVSFASPGFFSPENFRDLAVSNGPILVVAAGMTLVILARQIDVSIGSQFAICGVAAGLLVRAGAPMAVAAAAVLALGGLMGAVNGALVAGARLPSIVVTLATMTAGREGLRWVREGEDIYGLAGWQWFGLSQAAGQAAVVGAAIALFLAIAWGLRYLGAGRAVYAVGADEEAARLAGLNPPLVTFGVFVASGALTAAAALLSSVRFPQVQTNAGIGLEMQVIAAVVVGGVSISGGRGSIWGTLVGVALLGTIGNAMTYLKIGASWERALQGAIILGAVAAQAVQFGRKRNVSADGAVR
jgi:rhamnose transport system permease protein